MLTFEKAAINEIIEQHQEALAENGVADGWGCGPIVSNFSGLQGKFFRILGKQDRTPGNYPPVPRDIVENKRIEDEKSDGDRIYGVTNEYFHPITRIRRRILPNYNPASLDGFEIFHDQNNWRWVKGDIVVPEYVLRPERTMSVMHEGEYRTEPSLSRLLCPANLLADLDEDNNVQPD